MRGDGWGLAILASLIIYSSEKEASVLRYKHRIGPSEAVQQLQEVEGPSLDPARNVYETGLAALEPLGRLLSDDRQFVGACGGLASESVYVLEDVDSEDFCEPVARSPNLGEVSLYLIMAILDDNFFFAEHCLLESKGEEGESGVMSALLDVQDLLARTLQRGSLEPGELHGQIEELLGSRGLYFQKHEK